MAAQEYYFGSNRVENHNRVPNTYPSQPQYPYQQPPPPSQQNLQPYNTPPPSYSPYPQQQPRQQQGPLPPPHQQQWPANGRPASSTPYPATPPNQRPPFPAPPQQHNGHLGVPLQQVRSHSQPPRVHFEDSKYDSDNSTLFSPSDSDRSTRHSHSHRRRKHSSSSSHHHRHHRSSSSSPNDSTREVNSGRLHSHSPSRRMEHKDRDTFLGAGGGALIGDAIFPGLGTAAGLILGGFGGRKHAKAKKRSQSDVGERPKRSALAGQGWDPESATYGKGHAVR